MCVNNLPQHQTNNQLYPKQNLHWYFIISFLIYICLGDLMKNANLMERREFLSTYKNMEHDICMLMYEYLDSLQTKVSEFEQEVKVYQNTDVYYDSEEYNDINESRRELEHLIEEFKPFVKGRGFQDEIESLQEDIEAAMDIAYEKNDNCQEKGTMDYCKQIESDYMFAVLGR
jgi:hypothetical protein